MSNELKITDVLETLERPIVESKRRRRNTPFRETWLRECLDNRHAECRQILKIVPGKFMNLRSFRGICICKCHRNREPG